MPDFSSLIRRKIRGGYIDPIIGVVAIQDSSGDQVGIDSTVSALQTISVEHHEIHEGEHFFCSDDDQDVDTGANKYWHIKAFDSGIRCHFRFQVSSSLNGTIRFYENPDLSADGNKLTCFNNDRNSGNKARTSLYADPGINDAGTQLFVQVMGSDGINANGSDGGLVVRDDEIILKQAESYLIEFDTESDNNRVSFLAEFYEE